MPTNDYTSQSSVQMHGTTWLECQLYSIDGTFIGNLNLFGDDFYSCHQVRISYKSSKTQYDILKFVYENERNDLKDSKDVDGKFFI